MTREQFENLKVGETVEITQHGKNKGRRGIVSEIWKRGNMSGGVAYLTPASAIDGEFEFYNKSSKTLHNENGLCGFNHASINYPKPPLQPTNKHFYVGLMFGEDGISWPTDSFTDKELEVIDRFLTEFNEHVDGKMVDLVAILDDEEEEE